MADVTTLAESAQAIFCSLADILGSAESNKSLDLQKFKTFQEFQAFSQNKKDLQKAIDGVDVAADVKEILKFLDNTKNGWYASSVTIAKTLVTDLKKIDKDYDIAKKKRDYFDLRGKVGVMKDIAELWSIAKKSEPTKVAEKEIPDFIGFKDILL